MQNTLFDLVSIKQLSTREYGIIVDKKFCV